MVRSSVNVSLAQADVTALCAAGSADQGKVRNGSTVGTACDITALFLYIKKQVHSNSTE